jgi:hypothetical protein
MKKSFILHIDSLCILEEMTNDQAGMLFKAIYKFQLGEEPNLDFALRMAFTPFKNQFIRDNESYKNQSLINSLNGKKGGRPKKPNETEKTDSLLGKPTKPKKGDSDNDSDNESIKDKDSIIIINEEFLNFNKWLSENAPNVLKLKEQITEQQFLKLKLFDRVLVKDTLISMHNHKNLTKKYVSAYLTLTNWLKRNNNNNATDKITQHRNAAEDAISILTGNKVR